MIRKMLIAAALVAYAAVGATAAPTITVGNHDLLPNTPDQVISILASGNAPADSLIGLDLYLVVSGGTSGPIISELDLIGPGTIFSASNNGVQGFGPPYEAPSRELAAFVTTAAGTLNPNGVLAFLTIDTTGIFSGDFSLALSNDVFGDSALYSSGGAGTVLASGTLSVVPEPSSVVLGLFAAAGVAAVAVRRRRRS